MSVRTTIDLPDEGTRENGKRVTSPPIAGKGKPGPQCPDTENPYDILFA